VEGLGKAEVRKAGATDVHGVTRIGKWRRCLEGEGVWMGRQDEHRCRCRGDSAASRILLARSLAGVLMTERPSWIKLEGWRQGI